MRRLAGLVLALAALAAAVGARGDDVPFAQPPLSGSPVALADIMTGVQLRHIKLWEAIRGGNPRLVDFEATLIGDSLARAALLYSNIPIEYVLAAGRPLVELKSAAAAKDAGRLEAQFGQLTDACNACHVAANIPFVEIKTPSSSPFSNQRFAPGGR